MAGSSRKHRALGCIGYPSPDCRQLDETPEILAAWARYIRDGNDSDRNALLVFYSPIVARCACRMKRTHRDLCRDEIQELISDGLLGLLKFMRQADSMDFALNRPRMVTKVCEMIVRQCQARLWGGEARLGREKVVNRVRADLSLGLGREPNDEEFLHALRDQVTNPNFYLGDREVHTRGDLMVGGNIEALARETPDRRALDREAASIASKGLDATDRKLLRLILGGVSSRNLAKELKMPRTNAQRRVNGMLWTLRCRSDLANHLGFEASRMPPCRKARLPAVSMMPPARRIA